jgi:hypothetical protein
MIGERRPVRREAHGVKHAGPIEAMLVPGAGGQPDG